MKSKQELKKKCIFAIEFVAVLQNERKGNGGGAIVQSGWGGILQSNNPSFVGNNECFEKSISGKNVPFNLNC